MKTAFLCACILGTFVMDGFAAPRERAAGLAAKARTVAIVFNQRPAPVAEFQNDNGPIVGGVLVRLVSAPEPLQMINPMAPPEYGSARRLVTAGNSPDRDGNRNRRDIYSDGVKLLTISPPGW